MDQIEPLELPPNYLEAGRRYIDTIQDLGLELSAASWSCVENDHFRLLLVSDWAAKFGSLQLHQLLAVAYKAEILPQEINPFMVEIFTPLSAFGEVFLKTPNYEVVNEQIFDAEGQPVGLAPRIRLVLGIYEFKQQWRYDVRRHKGSADDIRKFKRFQRRVMEATA